MQLFVRHVVAPDVYFTLSANLEHFSSFFFSNQWRRRQCVPSYWSSVCIIREKNRERFQKREKPLLSPDDSPPLCLLSGDKFPTAVIMYESII